MNPLGLLKLQPGIDKTETILPQLIKCPEGHNPRESQITRMELQQMKNVVTLLLVEHSTQNKNICPIRSAIYRELFDELIRQVYIGQEESGILLARTRDEAYMSVGCYQTVYETTLQ